MSTHNDPTSDKQGSIPDLLGRLFGMFFGNVVLLFSIIYIVEHKIRLFHTADIIFWITVAALIIVRYLDINFLNGLTATGLPASKAHWTKYVTLLLVCSTVVWVLSHIVSYMVVK